MFVLWCCQRLYPHAAQWNICTKLSCSARDWFEYRILWETTSHFYGRIVLDWSIKRFHIVSLCANKVSGIPQLTCISLLMGRYFLWIYIRIEHATALCSLIAQPKNCKRKPDCSNKIQYWVKAVGGAALATIILCQWAWQTGRSLVLLLIRFPVKESRGKFVYSDGRVGEGATQELQSSIYTRWYNKKPSDQQGTCISSFFLVTCCQDTMGIS